MNNCINNTHVPITCFKKVILKTHLISLVCDIVIHKKYIADQICIFIYLIPSWFLAYSFQNPCNFLINYSNKVVFCHVNDVTFWIHLWMGLVARGTFSPTPWLPGSREGLEIINGQWCSQSCLCNEASIKNQKTKFREILGGETPGDLRR